MFAQRFLMDGLMVRWTRTSALDCRGWTMLVHRTLKKSWRRSSQVRLNPD